MANVHVKRDWRAHVPGFPPGETLNTRYCKVCERYLEDHPDIGINTGKEFGRGIAEDSPVPTSGDALERILVQGEMGHNRGIWEHLFVPGQELHRHATAADGGRYKTLEEMGVLDVRRFLTRSAVRESDLIPSMRQDNNTKYFATISKIELLTLHLAGSGPTYSPR